MIHKIRKIEIIISSIILLSSFFSWYSVEKAVYDSNASDFLLPLLFFSIYAISALSSIVLIPNSNLRKVLLIISFIISFLFSPRVLHFGVLLFSALIFIYSCRNIHSDILKSRKIKLGKSFALGMFFVVLSFAFSISSQYYFSVVKLDEENLLPRLEATGTSQQIFSFAISKLSPEFNQTQDEQITVDEFLSETYQILLRNREQRINNQNDSEKNLSRNEVWALQQSEQVFLQQWKRELSELAGYSLKGNEKISNVFISIINNRIDNLAKNKARNAETNLIPITLSVILFLSLITAGSIVSRVWIALLIVLFLLLKKVGVIKIIQEEKKVDIISLR